MGLLKSHRMSCLMAKTVLRILYWVERAKKVGRIFCFQDEGKNTIPHPCKVMQLSQSCAIATFSIEYYFVDLIGHNMKKKKKKEKETQKKH